MRKRKIRDPFVPDLFDPDWKPPIQLKRHPEDPKKQIDDKGNVYDERGLLIEEAPSKYVLEAMKKLQEIYPERKITRYDDDVLWWAKRFRKKEELQKLQEEKDKKKRKGKK